MLVIRQRAVVLTGEHVTQAAQPVIEGIRDVVAAGADDRAAATVRTALNAQADAMRAFARTRVTRVVFLALGVQLPLVAILAMAPWLIGRGVVTMGGIAGAVVYLTQQLDPAMRFLVSAAGTWLVQLGVVLGRLAEVTTCPSRAPRPTRRLPVRGHHLCAEKLTFAYSPQAEPVIRDLDLDIPAGMHLAVVGPSGVGKSTLANLLGGLVAPQCGLIRLGGTPLSELDDYDLRREVALIPQEAYIFAGTVADNLTYLQPNATTPDIDRVLTLFGLTETVARLGGLPGRIRPGGKGLSAGQRQLLALARVFLSPAEVIILDEASCHLDPVAEARAETAFAARHGTLVVIAHRISSALRAERILLMDGRRTVVGSHEELLARRTLYTDLVGYWEASASSALPRSSVQPPLGTV